MIFLESSLSKAEKYLQRNKKEKAVVYLRKALAEDPSNLTILTMLADVCAKLGNAEGARDNYLAVAKEYEQLGEINKAIGAYRKVYNLASDDFDSCLALARLYLFDRNYPQAEYFLKLCAEDFLVRPKLGIREEAIVMKLIRMLQTLCGVSQSSVDGLQLQAQLYRRIGRDRLASVLDLKIGLIYAREGKITPALAMLQPLLAIFPNNIELIHTLAELLAGQGRLQEALRALDGCLSTQPNNVQLLLEKAKLLTRFGEFEQAEELYHKAMFSDPSNYKELLDFAYRLKDAGLFNRAIQQIEHIPGELTFLQKMEIVTFCRALLDNDPHNIQALTKLAYFYGEMNDIFQLSSVYLSLFRVYMQQQSYERAHQAGKLLLDLGYRDSKFLKAYEQNKSHLKLNEDAQLREQGPTVQTENLVKLDTSKVRLWPNTCLETQEVEAKALSHKEEGLPDMLLNIELLLKYGARDKALELLQQSVRDFGDNPELREKLRNYYLAKSPVAYAALESMRLSEMVKDRVEKKKSGKIPAYRPPASEMATAITARSPLSAEELVVQDALPGFTGDLRMFMLIDIIQLISASNKTGTLCVINGDNTGLAYFNSGRLVSSEYGNYAGEEAVFQLLQVNDGFFEFRPSEAPFRESIEISTTNLLLEGLRRIDEQRRNNASAASSAEIGEIEERFGS